MNAIPKVVHVVISLEPGGLERLVVDWTNARNREHPGSTSIVCLDRLGLLADQVEGACVTCVNAHRDKFPWDRMAVRRIREAVVSSQKSVDSRIENDNSPPSTFHLPPPRGTIVHAHNLAAWQYAVLAARGTGRQVVYTQHGNNPHSGGMLNRLRARLCIGRTDRIVAVSRTVAEYMARHQGFPRARIEIVPNGIKLPPPVTAQQRTTARAQLDIPQDAFVVGSIGRFSPEKNYPLLVAAFASFYKGHARAKLILVGDGPERQAIQEVIETRGITGACVLPGMRSDIGAWLNVLDVFCLSSETEGMSVALLEAGAYGLPAIVTDVGGNAEIVKNGVTGLVINAGNESGFVAALTELSGDEIRRQTMGKAARERIEQNYSCVSALAAYESLYGKTIDDRQN